MKILLTIINLIITVNLFSSNLLKKQYLVKQSINELVKSGIEIQKTGILVLDPNTGGILGCLNKNKCIKKNYSIGSIFKLVSAFALLKKNYFKKTSIYKCTGKYYIYKPSFLSAGRLIHEDEHFPKKNDYYKCTRSFGHGIVNLKKAIAYSCNNYFFNQYLNLNYTKLKYFSRILGLTESTTVNNQYSSYPVFNRPSILTKKILSTIGHSVKTSLISSAVFFNTIINNGKVLYPQEIPKHGYIKQKIKRYIQANHIFNFLKQSLSDCVIYGTARKIKNYSSIDISGKTGTGIINNNIFKTVGWFISYAPRHQPQILIVSVSAYSTGSNQPLKNSGFLYKKLTKYGFFNLK